MMKMKEINIFPLVVLLFCVQMVIAQFDGGMGTGSINVDVDALSEMDNKYPYLPIKLKDFVVTDKDSPSADATEEDNRRSREITREEKSHVLESIDLMRFVVNTPEFETLFFDDSYTFNAAEDGSGVREIKEGDPFDKNIIFNMLKNAAITTYILKDDIDFSSNALGTQGPYFYVQVDAENPIIEGDNDRDPWTPRDLLIILPNSHDWTSSIYADRDYLAGLLFHELIHNLGFKHVTAFPALGDIANSMEDIFRELVTATAWQEKYKTALSEFNYYQTKYKHFLLSDSAWVLATDGVLTISTDDGLSNWIDHLSRNPHDKTLVTSLILEAGVSTIIASAFLSHGNMVMATIPRSVTSIGDMAFEGCSGLRDVSVEWDIPLLINADVFRDVTLANVRLTLPRESVNLYKNAPVWQDFKITSDESSLEVVDAPSYKVSQMVISPNPVSRSSGAVTIYFPQNILGTGTCTIYDAQGNRIDHQEVNLARGTAISWDLCNKQGRRVASGGYLVILQVTDSMGMMHFAKSMIGVSQ